MASIVTTVVNFYNLLDYELADPRTRGKMIFNDFSSIFGVLLLYNIFILKLGPAWMKNRPAFNLKKIILLFDLIQVILNLILLVKSIQIGWLWKLSFFCTELYYDDTPHARQVIDLCNWFYWIKLSDLIDTVFFILTKKFNHVSFLHIYHHNGMAFLGWCCVKWFAGGHHTFVALINSFVHMVMYSYYLVTTIYPQKKLFKVKKIVTKIQMYQFLIGFVHFSMVLFVKDCHYPKVLLFCFLPNNLMIFLLFYDFYWKTYICKKQKKTE